MPRRVLFVAAFIATPAAAQQPRALTADDYARVERFLGYNTNPLVSGATVRPAWLAADRFWYLNTTADGVEYVLVDPVRRTRTAAFDHVRVAAALSRAADPSYDARRLTLGTLTFSALRLDLLRCPGPALDLRRARRGLQLRYSPRFRDAQRHPLARRETGGVHPGRQPVGAGRGERA